LETLSPAGDIYELDDFTGPVVVNRGGIGFFDAGSVGTNMQYGLKLTNMWRGHEIRYGVQYENIDYSCGANYSGPTFTAFNGQQTTTVAIVESITGAAAGMPNIPVVYVTLRDLLSPVQVPTTTGYLNWFAQDSWNISSYLNLKFGVRWEKQDIKGDLPG